jgi:uncharacterized protein (DUF1330 family)
MAQEALVLVVTLDVRRDARVEFHQYETAAASLMAAHGGRIERVIEVIPESPDTFREIHIVRFPDRTAFEAYRLDPRLPALASLRSSSIVSTQIVQGRDGPSYHSAV